MQSEFAGDIVDLDRSVVEAATERPGKPLRLRVQPMIQRHPTGRNSQYQSWTGVSWTLEVDTATEAIATRDALRAFFEALTRVGPESVQRALEAAGKESAA